MGLGEKGKGAGKCPKVLSSLWAIKGDLSLISPAPVLSAGWGIPRESTGCGQSRAHPGEDSGACAEWHHPDHDE